MTRENLAKMIDHTNLNPTSTESDIRKLCKEAMEYNFYSVCINPTWVSYAKNILGGSNIKICTVIGFPLGATTSEIKASETRNAIRNGADEIDMVINIGFLKGPNINIFERDIEMVRKACEKNILKVIIETCLLNEKEKILACQISKKLNTDFVKTSTGFSTKGATIEDIKLMRKILGKGTGIKASGGIKNYQNAVAMINAGANRIGTSKGVSIVESCI